MSQQNSVKSPGKILTYGPPILFEQILGGQYVVYNRGPNRMEISDVYEDGEIIYEPLQEDQVAWPLPSALELHESLEMLYGDIRRFIYDRLDFDNDALYDVLTSYVLLTWRREDFVVVPYIFFLGPYASGKTRALEVIFSLAYRALLSPNVSLASVYHLIEKFKVTLCLDETEVYMRGNRDETLQLINAGYSVGQKAVRVLEDGKEVRLFDVFGPKAFAGTHDLITTLTSRCIPFQMGENVRPIRKRWDKTTKLEADSLRCRLLDYRFKTVLTPLEPFKEDVIPNSRIEELFYGLISVAPENVKQKLYDFAIRLCGERKEEESTTELADIIYVMQQAKNQVNGGKLLVSTITDAYNLSREESERFNSKQIGKRLKTLGFRKARGAGGIKCVWYDTVLIEKLVSRYLPPTLDAFGGISKETSLTSHSSLPVKVDSDSNNGLGTSGTSGTFV